MAGGLVLLTNLLGRFTEQAEKAADSTDRVADSAGRLPPVPVTPETRTPLPMPEGRGVSDAVPPQDVPLIRNAFSAGSRVIERAADDVEDAAGDVTDAAHEIVDVLEELRGGADIGDFDVRQKDLIDQIRNTAFGRYLDKYAEIFLELERGGLTPQRKESLRRALDAPNIGARDIIDSLTGPAGKKFNFFKFEQDLKALLKKQMDEQKERDAAAKRGNTPTSGLIGQSTGGVVGIVSLDVLRRAGVIR